MRRVAMLLLLVAIAAGEESVAALARKVESEQMYERWEACEALRKLGPAAKAAVPALIKALKDEHVCADAAMALGRIAPRDRRVIEALVAALDTAPLHHRREVVRALAGAPFNPALAWLLNETRTNAHGSADRARQWLREILDTDAALVDGLVSSDERVRKRAVVELDDPALAAAMLRDRSPTVRVAAAMVLQYDEHAGPLLVRALPDPDRFTARAIVSALGKHHVGWMAALEVDWDGAVKFELAPRNARRLLIEHTRDPEGFEKMARAVAAAPFAPSDAHLLEALKDDNPPTRRCAALLLGYLAKDKQEAARALRDLLDQDSQVRGYAEASRARLTGNAQQRAAKPND